MVKYNKYSSFVNSHGEQDELVKAAVDDIITSGLTPETLEAAQVRIFNRDATTLCISLNRDKLEGKYFNNPYKLVEFPYFHENRGIAHSRFKLFPAANKKGGGTIKYLHPNGVPSTPYILPGVWEVKDKAHKPVWFTEGEKKTLKLLQHDKYAIGLPGVWSYKENTTDGISVLSTELAQFNWQGRTVFFAFDSDLWVNPQVLFALYELAARLFGKGAIVKIALWSQMEGKGVDDYLVGKEQQRQKAEDVLAAMEANAILFEDFICPEHEDAVIRALTVAELPHLKQQRLIKVVAKKIGVDKKTLLTEISVRQREDVVDDEVTFTDEQVVQAMALLKSPDLV
ncbi:DUF3854 domain-containing protein [Candidatus Magnetominusculus xianensis]|uniref:DUF3854 domain-containing protein n=1 Tax=Candidatus Magnetominusculus xianensis TaxID=1748249 RepID=A0ABR5SCL6_9BACT|nr:DUF3854 domain-containing protein [Candidatus Magnetominusculus xianensis]KWT75954.1 hypothetical protein ASN18_3195 [Candidatus Magnetominusculus xianensis]MBF0405046.1 DUF3854 domain-containing protein [Nitrospirota bacterium]